VRILLVSGAFGLMAGVGAGVGSGAALAEPPGVPGSTPNAGRPVPGRPVPTRPSPNNAPPALRSLPDFGSRQPGMADTDLRPPAGGNSTSLPREGVSGTSKSASGCRWMARRAVQTRNDVWWDRYRECIAGAN
jgi:hypothetical protein